MTAGDAIQLDLTEDQRGKGNPNPVLSARDTLRTVLERARPWAVDSTAPRWAVVADLTLHGSGYSSALCRSLGLDPDEPLTARPAP